MTPENVNTPVLFENPEFGKVRVVMREGEPWFVAKDVCDCLGLDLSSGARNLDEDEKGLHTMQTLGGMQQMQVVSEAGLYQLIFRSRKDDAKKFKRWVTHEVLPSIRKTGSYSVLPRTYLEALKALVASEEAKERAERERAAALGVVAEQNLLIDAQQDELGRGKNYKAVTAFPWLREYFKNASTETCKRIGMTISNMCKARGYVRRQVEDTRWGKVWGYPVKAIEEFRQLLDENPYLLNDIRKK